MIAKCGETNAWHWAHQGRRPFCDPWWENKTEWHRSWQDQFPTAWQEVFHTSGGGERHIADVKTDQGWVIEFQHSYLKPDERRAREAFYRKLMWVVDGTRRERDRRQLLKAWEDGVGVPARNSPVRKTFADDCRLLGEWAGSSVPVFFDLGDAEVLWWFFKSIKGSTFVVPYQRAQFIAGHRSTATEIVRRFIHELDELPKAASEYESPRAQPMGWNPLQPPRPRRPFRL